MLLLVVVSATAPPILREARGRAHPLSATAPARYIRAGRAVRVPSRRRPGASRRAAGARGPCPTA